MANATPCFFKPAQAHFKPLYEWAFGERNEHPETTARVHGALYLPDRNDPTKEGGYHPPTLGDNAVAFLRGMRESLCQEAELQ